MFKHLLLITLVVLATPLHAVPLARIGGTVFTLERMAVPANATLTLELVDTTGDAQGGRLAQLTLPTRGRQAPFDFAFAVAAADLDSRRAYRLHAAILDDRGERLFEGMQALPGTATQRIRLRLTRAPGQRAPLTLEDTHWKLIEVAGQPAHAQPGERGAYLLLLNGQASGSSGCNKLMGRYTLGAQQQLGLGQMASTRMACAPEWMAQESALFAAFTRTTGYRIDGRILELRDGDTVLARFSARAAP